MATEEPIKQIIDWLGAAEKKEPSDPGAMSIATVGANGRPSLRMVLLRGIDERGLVFYTNLASGKAVEIRTNPWVALCLHWKSTDRQVRVEGRAELVSEAEADAYFTSRDRESQIGAWASKQSQPLVGRFKLERRVAKFAARYAISSVPRPEFWSGYRVVPERVEFWEKRPFRLHERTLYEREGDAWAVSRLYP
ncbi:MAG: pyridoxamine 5'-phosphate oxidase [Gammaproteobacteria bacterium]|nr:pyridoxamine 5'-phosphate oxidase [Gammaproteobacteria bacterium]